MPSDPTTWALLKASVEAWTDIDVTDAQVEEFIALAERHFQRTVFGPEREATADLTLNLEVEALPTDCWGIRELYLDSDPKTVLEYMPLSELRNAYSASMTGRPQNYSVRGENLILGPSPDTTYTGKLSYWQTVPALGAAQATNWLITDHPDLYLAGALAEAFTYHMDEARMGQWIGKRDAIIDAINESTQLRMGGSVPRRIRSSQVV
jgi:hypothetical protein